MVAVEVALELQQFRAAGEGAGQTQAVHRRLAAGAGEADKLQAGNRRAQQTGEFGVQFIFVGAGGAAVQHRLDGAAHARVAVAEQRGAVAATEVEILAAVQVPDAAAVGSVEVERMADGAIDARRGADAARERLLRPLKLLNDTAHVRIQLPMITWLGMMPSVTDARSLVKSPRLVSRCPLTRRGESLR